MFRLRGRLTNIYLNFSWGESNPRFGIRSSLEEFTLLRRVFVINTLLSLFFRRKTLPSFSKFSFSAYLWNQLSLVAINTAAYFISATIKLDSLYFHQGTVLVSYENARNPSKCQNFSVLFYIFSLSKTTHTLLFCPPFALLFEKNSSVLLF